MGLEACAVDGRDDVKKQALLLGFFFKNLWWWCDSFLGVSVFFLFFLDFGARGYRCFISAICCRDFLLSAIKIFDNLAPESETCVFRISFFSQGINS